MNVSELYQLTKWIQNEIVNTQIPQKYQQLLQILQRNAQPNQPKQPFEQQKNNLIEAIKKVPLNQLTRDQIEFLKKLGIGEAVGQKGVERIEDILYRNALDIVTAAQKIREIYQALNNGIQKANQIKMGLDGCILEESYEVEDKVLMRIYFKEKAALSNVTDLKKWGAIWYEIIRGIAIAHSATPEEVKIVGATSGSIVIEMAAAATIASTTSIIILSALKVAERFVEILKKVEELRSLKLNNQKLLAELEKEAQKEKEKGINEISNKVVNILRLNEQEQGDLINALKKSIEHLVNFIELGGEVDFIVPDEDEADKEKQSEKDIDYSRIKEIVREIREIESKIKALEPPNSKKI